MRETISVKTPEKVEFVYELAGLGSRFYALLLDSLAQGLIIGFWILALVAVYEVLDVLGGVPERLGWILAAAGVLGAFFISWGYFVLYESRRGATPGKRIAGIRVLKDDGAAVGFFDAATRNILRIIDVLPTSYAVGAVSILASKANKRVGDFAAGTVVVRMPKTAHDFDEEAIVPGIPATHQRVLREFLERRGEIEDRARQRIAAELAAKLGVESGESLEETEERLEELLKKR